MTVSQKIFHILDTKGISQKEFSIATGIPQSTISDWRKKNTNPASDKILAICDFLDITPYELLSNVTEEGSRSNKANYRIIVDGTDEATLIEMYEDLDMEARNRLLGYMEALKHK